MVGNDLRALVKKNTELVKGWHVKITPDLNINVINCMALVSSVAENKVFRRETLNDDHDDETPRWFTNTLPGCPILKDVDNGSYSE